MRDGGGGKREGSRERWRAREREGVERERGRKTKRQENAEYDTDQIAYGMIHNYVCSSSKLETMPQDTLLPTGVRKIANKVGA